MFTADQLKTAHSKVKSGADFPAYIREIRTLGVTSYETYVTDGHTDYSGAGDYHIHTPARHSPLPIADESQPGQFRAALKAHQQGETDYATFLRISAACGIEKWAVCLNALTCTYYDKAGTIVLVEQIPQ